MAGYARAAGSANVSATTATPETVLLNRIFCSAAGELSSGAMANNGALTRFLDALTSSIIIPRGYHDGEGSVSVRLQEKTASAGAGDVEVTPDAGRLLSKVIIQAIALLGSADEADVLSGKTFYNDSLIAKSGSLSDQTRTTNHAATPSLYNNYLRMKIPAAGKYGVGNYLRASYASIAGLIGLSAEKLISGNSVLGVDGSGGSRYYSDNAFYFDSNRAFSITGLGFKPFGFAFMIDEGWDSMSDSTYWVAGFAVRDPSAASATIYQRVLEADDVHQDGNIYSAELQDVGGPYGIQWGDNWVSADDPDNNFMHIREYRMIVWGV